MDWSLVITVIGVLVAIAALSEARRATRYARKQVQLATESDLEIRVAPTRKSRRQMAQVCLYNRGACPIQVVAYAIRWGVSGQIGESLTTSAQETLPRILGSKESHNFLIDVAERPIEELTGIGVEDRSRRMWWASDDDMQIFVRVAIQNAPPETKAAVETVPDATDNDIEVEAIADGASENRSGGLRLRILNRTLRSLALQFVEVKWKYEPVRYIGGGEGKPRVEEIEGGITIGRDHLPKAIAPHAYGECSIGREMRGLLACAGAPDVSPEAISVLVVSSQGHAWRASGDGVSDVIKAVATQIATTD